MTGGASPLAVPAIAEQSFRRLQLRTVRLLGTMLAVSLGMRLLFASPAGEVETALVLGRYIYVAFLVLATVLPSEHNAAQYGLTMVVLAKILITLKSLSVPPGEVAMLTAVFGLHRLLPFCVAVFGGVRACVAMAVCISVDILGITLWRRAQLAEAPFALPAMADVVNWYRDDRDAAVLWTELNIVWMATGLACAIVQTHHQAMAQLVDALVSRQRFISNMNHEIRTPLVGVLGVVDLLLARTDVAGDLKDQLSVVLASGKALLALVNNILDLSRMDARMLKLDLRPVDVRTVLRTVTDTFAATAQAKGVHCRLDVDSNVPPALVLDETRLQQVAGNLVGNAFKFTAHGAVTVEARMTNDDDDDAGALRRILDGTIVAFSEGGEPTPPKAAWSIYDATARSFVVVAGTAQAASNPPRGGRTSRWWTPHPTGGAAASRGVGNDGAPRLWIQVVDSGIGIASDAMPGIFRPFQQADNSTTRRFGGSGLGLAICTELVELMHGTLLVASAPGRGACFMVSIPCPQPATAGVPRDATSFGPPAGPVAAIQPAPGPASGHRPLVLVVEDNAVNASVLARQLDLAGCDALVALDGQQALAYIAEDFAGPLAGTQKLRHRRPAPAHIHLVLMDLDMPVMDGLAATRAIRDLERSLPPTTERRGRLPIFAITASDRSSQEAACLDAGMDGYLVKPTTVSALRGLVAANSFVW